MGWRLAAALALICAWTALPCKAQEASPISGSQWVSIGLRGKEIRALAMNPSAPSILYVAARDALYEGSTNGEGWIPLTIDLPGVTLYSLQVDRSIPSLLYIGTIGTVYKSRNGGRSWKVALRDLVDPPFTALALHPQDSAILYVGSKIGVMKTTSGSEEGWDQADKGLNGRDLKLLAMDPAHPSTLFAGSAGGAVYRSTDAGGIWVDAGKGLPGAAITLLTVDPASSAVYAGARKKGLYRSTDAGVSWQALGNALAALTVQCIAVDPATPARLFVGTDSAGILRSTDGGNSWAPFNAGLTDTDVRAISAFPGERKGEVLLYAGANGGLWKLGDAARVPGKPAAMPLESMDLPASRFVRTIAIDPRAPSTLYAGTAGSGIFKTTDSGQSWVSANLPGASVATITIGADSALYAGTRGKIYQSVDGGKTWRVSLTDMADPAFFGIAVDPKFPQIVYEGNEYGVSKSTDRGQGWDSGGDDALKDVTFLQMHATKSGAVFAGTDGHGIFLSENAGAQWKPINTGLTKLSILALAQDAKGSSTLYAGSDGGGVYKSNDGGKTWQATMSAGLARAPVTALALGASASTVFAGIYGGGVYESTDAGKSWHSMSDGLLSLRIRALAVDPDHPSNVWAGTDGGGAFRSTNGAKNWHAIDFGNAKQPAPAESNMQTPDYDADIQKALQEAQSHPSDGDAYNSLGLAYYAKGEFEKAEANYQRALKLDPTGTYFHSNLAFVRFDQKRYAEALQLMEQELELNPDAADALAGKAICLQALGKHQEALDAYAAAAERDHSYTDCKILRVSNSWSAAACKAAQPLIEKLFH